MERAKKDEEEGALQPVAEEAPETKKASSEQLKTAAFHLLKNDASGSSVAKALELIGEIDKLIPWDGVTDKCPALGAIRYNFLRNAKDWIQEGKMDRARHAINGMMARTAELASIADDAVKAIYDKLVPLVAQLDENVPK